MQKDKKNEYGFVYIWRDRKHNRFYIGCHWGREDDGYICSSDWMRHAYKRRPQDFKRRILKRIDTNRRNLLKEEQKWLNLVKKEELGKSYYNFQKQVTDNPWWGNQDSKKTVGERISQTLAKPEIREKRRQSMIQTLAKKFPNPGHDEFNYKLGRKRLKFNSPEYNEIMRQKSGDRWQDHSYRKRVGFSISKSLYGVSKTGNAAKGHIKSDEHKEKIRQSNLGKKVSEETCQKLSDANRGKIWWTNGLEEIRAKECPTGWRRGRCDEYKQRIKALWAKRKESNITINT